MKDAAILDGDLVICEPRQFAENGEIVVALIHQEEATVKRFFLGEKQIELRLKILPFGRFIIISTRC